MFSFPQHFKKEVRSQRILQRNTVAIYDDNLQCFSTTVREKYADGYRALKEQLSTLPDRVSYSIMVPFGNVAFMPGKLVRTNEIRVLLGDDRFVDRSAKQAVEIVNRRLKIVDEDAAGLERQRDLFKPHLDFTKEFREQAQQEAQIVEEHNEDEEKAWRSRHRLKVKKHYEEQRAARDAEKLKDEKEYWKSMEEAEAEGRETEEPGIESSPTMSLDKINQKPTPIFIHSKLFRPKQNLPPATSNQNQHQATVLKVHPSTNPPTLPQRRTLERACVGKTSNRTSRRKRTMERRRRATTARNTLNSVDQRRSISCTRHRLTLLSHVMSEVNSDRRFNDRFGRSSDFVAGRHRFIARVYRTKINSQETLEQRTEVREVAAVVLSHNMQKVKSSSHVQPSSNVIPTPVRQPLKPATTFPAVKVVERNTSLYDSSKTNSDSTNSLAADASSNEDGSKRISKFKVSRLKKAPNTK